MLSYQVLQPVLLASLISAIIKLPSERLGMTHLRGILSSWLWSRSLYRLFFWPNHLAGPGDIWALAVHAMAASSSCAQALGMGVQCGVRGWQQTGCQALRRGTRDMSRAVCHAVSWGVKDKALRSVLIKKPRAPACGTESFVKPPQQIQVAKKGPQGKHPPVSFEVEKMKYLVRWGLLFHGIMCTL